MNEPTVEQFPSKKVILIHKIVRRVDASYSELIEFAKVNNVNVPMME